MPSCRFCDGGGRVTCLQTDVRVMGTLTLLLLIFALSVQTMHLLTGF